LDSDDRVINFRIVNSVSSNTTETNSQEGIGLKNIKSRLELMYPHRYEFNATRSATEFAVEMKIVIA
jgi:two-component system, LytTR family, sensor kinase